MHRLGHTDWTRFASFLEALYAESDPGKLPQAMLQGLTRLIPCEHASYNEIDGRTNAVAFALHPWVQEILDLTPALTPHMGEHPQLRHFRRNADRGAHQTTDFLSSRQFRQTGMYRDFYQHAATGNQLAILLSEFGASGETGIAINRKRGEFSARDRAVLELARPHLIRARHNVAALAEAQRRVRTLDETLDSLHTGVAVVNADLEILWLTPPAVRLLEAFFPGAMRSSKRLPMELDQGLRAAREVLRSASPAAPLPVFGRRRGETWLTVRFLPENDGMIRLVLRREAVAPAQGRAGAWGLTPREAELLHWISEAKTNPEIATILNISPRTVHKHVEHILAKLGVETRMAAARKAVDWSDPRPPLTTAAKRNR